MAVEIGTLQKRIAYGGRKGKRALVRLKRMKVGHYVTDRQHLRWFYFMPNKFPPFRWRMPHG